MNGPAYDLPTVMTKFLRIGMPLNDVIASVTSRPAKAYGLYNEIGSLSVGKCADVTVLKITDCDVELEDTVGQKRNVRRRVLPVAVWREGATYPIQIPEVWPAKDTPEICLQNARRLIIN